MTIEPIYNGLVKTMAGMNNLDSVYKAMANTLELDKLDSTYKNMANTLGLGKLETVSKQVIRTLAGMSNSEPMYEDLVRALGLRKLESMHKNTANTLSNVSQWDALYKNMAAKVLAIRTNAEHQQAAVRWAMTPDFLGTFKNLVNATTVPNHASLLGDLITKIDELRAITGVLSSSNSHLSDSDQLQEHTLTAATNATTTAELNRKFDTLATVIRSQPGPVQQFLISLLASAVFFIFFQRACEPIQLSLFAARSLPSNISSRDAVREQRSFVEATDLTIADSLRIVRAKRATVRSSFKPRSPHMAVLCAGTVVRVVQKHKGWVQVQWICEESHVRSGWMKSKYLVRFKK